MSAGKARLRGAVSLPFPQHPVRSLGQMAGDSYDGASVALVWIEPVIEQADVILAMGLDANGAVGCRKQATHISRIKEMPVLPCQVFPADANLLGDFGFRRTFSFFLKTCDGPPNPGASR